MYCVEMQGGKQIYRVHFLVVVQWWRCFIRYSVRHRQTILRLVQLVQNERKYESTKVPKQSEQETE